MRQDTGSLMKARRSLRAMQQTQGRVAGLVPIGSGDGLMDVTLDQLRRETATVATDHPDIVRRGVMRFDRALEESRVRRAEELIRRVEPGPFEDPHYLALLAYQAAAVEWALLSRTTGVDEPPADAERAPGTIRDRLSRVLLGTLAAPEVNAFAQVRGVSDHVLVALHSGLIDFLYQAAKALVEAVDPISGEEGKSSVQANMDVDVVRQRLETSPGPAERVTRSLESYFYNGYPRHVWNETVDPLHSPFLNDLIALSERWVIAHEYGHALVVGRDFSGSPSSPSRSEELIADNHATFTTVLSADVLDRLPPEVAVSAALFALASLEVLRRARSLTTTGQVAKDVGSASHPSNLERAQNVITAFRTFFDVEYPPQGGYILRPVLRPQAPPTHGFGPEHSDRAFRWARILLEVLWPHARERLGAQVQLGRPLHRMWR